MVKQCGCRKVKQWIKRQCRCREDDYFTWQRRPYNPLFSEQFYKLSWRLWVREKIRQFIHFTYNKNINWDVRGVNTWFPENPNNKKTVLVATFCMFSFCQYDSQRSSRTSDSALITAGAPRRSSLPCYFSYLHPISSRRPAEREWGRPALSSPPAASQTVRTMSQTVKESRPPSLRPPHTSWKAPSSSLRKTACSPTWPTSLRASPFSWERRKPFWPTFHGPERVSWHSLACHSPLRRT